MLVVMERDRISAATFCLFRYFVLSAFGEEPPFRRGALIFSVFSAETHLGCMSFVQDCTYVFCFRRRATAMISILRQLYMAQEFGSVTALWSKHTNVHGCLVKTCGQSTGAPGEPRSSFFERPIRWKTVSQGTTETIGFPWLGSGGPQKP